MKVLIVYLSCLVVSEPSAEEILRRADAILAPEGYRARVELESHRSDGSRRGFTMDVLKSGSDRLRVSFLAPSDDRGSEILRIGDNLWHYLPRLKRSLKISPRQDFHGGDFSNADVLRVDLDQDYRPALGAAADPKEWLLELRAKDDRLPYDRIQLWIRKSDFMPLRQELYTRSGRLVRRLEMSEPRRFGSLVRPTRFVMHNVLVPSRRTVMTWTAFSVAGAMEPGLFELAALGR